MNGVVAMRPVGDPTHLRPPGMATSESDRNAGDHCLEMFLEMRTQRVELRCISNELRWSSRPGLCRGHRHFLSCHVGDEFDGCDARQEHVRRGFGRDEGRETCYLDRRAPICLRDHENAFRGVLGANQRIFRLWVKPDAPGEFAVIDPASQHELILVFDVRVDEIAENPALDAIVRFPWIDRSARKAEGNESAGENYCCRRAPPGPRLAHLVG